MDLHVPPADADQIAEDARTNLYQRYVGELEPLLQQLDDLEYDIESGALTGPELAATYTRRDTVLPLVLRYGVLAAAYRPCYCRPSAEDGAA